MGIGVDPAFALKVLLLFAAEVVDVRLVGFGTLLASVVAVAPVFLAGDAMVELGDLGVNFLRFPAGVSAVFLDDEAGDGAGLDFVGVAELPPSFRTRPAGGVAVVFGGARVPAEGVVSLSFCARWDRVRPPLPPVVFCFSLPFLVSCTLSTSEDS